MLNRELEVTLNLAFKEARTKRHEFMTVEHLLLALLDNEAAATVLRACGASLDKLRHDLQEFIDSTTPSQPWAFSGYCSERSFMSRVRVSVRLLEPTCWLRSSASRKARRYSC